MCTGKVWMPPATGLRSSVCPVTAPGSQSSHILAPGHGSSQGCNPTAIAGTDPLSLNTLILPLEIPRPHGLSRSWLRPPSKNQLFPWPHP